MCNKHSNVCSIAESRIEEPKPHNSCYKNWNGSLQAMEAGVIIEVFQKAKRMHGVRHMQLNADGVLIH